MKNLKNVLIVISFSIFVLVSLIFADTTWVSGDIEGGVWDLDGSPYIIQDMPTLLEGEELTIDPGVTVILYPGEALIIENAVLLARGNAEDSIRFLPYSWNLWDEWLGIAVVGRAPRVEFEYCLFTHQHYGYEYDGAIQFHGGPDAQLSVDHCSFINCTTGISTHAGGNVEVPFLYGLTSEFGIPVNLITSLLAIVFSRKLAQWLVCMVSMSVVGVSITVCL